MWKASTAVPSCDSRAGEPSGGTSSTTNALYDIFSGIATLLSTSAVRSTCRNRASSVKENTERWTPGQLRRGDGGLDGRTLMRTGARKRVHGMASTALVYLC